MRKAAFFLLAAATAACGGSTGQPAPDQAGLAYTVPDPNPLRYTTADTASLGMDMGGTAIDISIRSAASVEADFTSTASGLSATVRYLDISGAFANSMAPTINAGAADLPGPATLSLDRRGRITVDALPQTTEAFRQLFGSQDAFRKLFIRLPGNAVDRGTSWTDTVSVTENLGEMNTTRTEIITSVLGNDTTVDSRTYRVIRSEINGDTRIAGSTQGMEITQQLTSNSTAVTLWDPARRAVYERTEMGNASGSMAIPSMGVAGVPITMRMRSVIRLQTM